MHSQWQFLCNMNDHQRSSWYDFNTREIWTIDNHPAGEEEEEEEEEHCLYTSVVKPSTAHHEERSTNILFSRAATAKRLLFAIIQN